MTPKRGPFYFCMDHEGDNILRPCPVIHQDVHDDVFKPQRFNSVATARVFEHPAVRISDVCAGPICRKNDSLTSSFLSEHGAYCSHSGHVEIEADIYYTSSMVTIA